MRTTTFVGATACACLLLVGCLPKEDPQAELARVEQVFQSCFGGIGKRDFQAIRTGCSSDDLLLGDCTVWTVEDHIKVLKPLEGRASSAYRLVMPTKESMGRSFGGLITMLPTPCSTVNQRISSGLSARSSTVTR
jgi:hypothetical protein